MRPSMLGNKPDGHGPASVKDTRPVCSADGCSRREPCGFACRDNGNFDVKEVKKLTFEEWYEKTRPYSMNLHQVQEARLIWKAAQENK